MAAPRIVDMSASYPLGVADSGGGNPLNQLVIHFTVSGSECPVARNLVASVQAGRAGGATQVYVDNQEVVITGPARRKYWATGSALGHNSTTYNIEICGGIMYGSRGNPNGPDDDWLNPADPAGQAFINAAWWGAKVCHEYEINPVLMTVAQTRDPNYPGITTHYRISVADGPGGSDHVDWDDTEPIGEFVALLKKFYDNPGMVPGDNQEDEVTPADIKAIADAVWKRQILTSGYDAETVLYWANKKGWDASAALDKLDAATIAAQIKADPAIRVDAPVADVIAYKVVAAFAAALGKDDA